MPAFLANPALWGKIIAAVAMMVIGGFLVHRWDDVVIKTKEVEIANLKAQSEQEKRAAMEWGLQKQREYDNAAISAAQKYAQAEADRADAAERRAAAVPPATVLVRGCLTAEFVRTLNAAVTDRTGRPVLQPAGKPDGSCTTVGADTVVRWVLGVIDVAQHNADQLDALIGSIRAAQALR